jgi:predicted Zn-dependent protease
MRRRSSHVRRWVQCVLTGALLSCASAWAHPGIDQQIADITARLAEHPDDATLYLRRGELHRIHRDWTAAETDYLKARKLDGKLAEVDLSYGTMKLDAGDPTGARKALTRYLKQRPDSVRGRVARARSLVKLGKYLEAVRDYSIAVEKSESGRPQPDYYLEQARALEAAGPAHRDRALAVLDRGLARLSEPVTLQLYAIEIELGLERHDAALARLDRIADRSPRKETWLLRRGEILEQAGRAQEATLAYRGTLEAIDKLPVGRRSNRAVQRLVAQATSALERLETEQ